MAIAYPSSLLPSFNELHNYSETPPNTLISFQPDVGPPKIRRRLTKAVRKISGTLLMYSSQVDLFDTWFNSSTGLNGGALTLSSLHPRSTDAIEAYLDIPVISQQSGGRLFNVNINLMII